MTPKKKAKKLVKKYTKTIWDSGNTVSKQMVKHCALIAVDEIIGIKLLWYQKDEDELTYWKQVKTEIEKL